MTTNNIKTVVTDRQPLPAPAPTSLLGRLAAAQEARQATATAMAEEARRQVTALVGADLSVEAMEELRKQILLLLTGEEQATAIADLDRALKARKEAERATAEALAAKRLSDPAYLAEALKAKAEEAAGRKQAELAQKARLAAQAEREAEAREAVAREERVEAILAVVTKMAEVSEKEAKSIANFLRATPAWKFAGDEKAVAALRGAAGRVARERAEAAKQLREQQGLTGPKAPKQLREQQGLTGPKAPKATSTPEVAAARAEFEAAAARLKAAKAAPAAVTHKIPLAK